MVQTLMENDLKEFLSIADLSEYLSIKRSTLYLMVERGEIPCFRFGRLVRFKRQEIDAWIEGHKEKVINPDKKGREIFKRVKNTGMDIERVVKKSIESVKNRRYNRSHGRPDQVRGLRKEAKDGAI